MAFAAPSGRAADQVTAPAEELLGRILLQKKEYERAHGHFEQLLKIAPGNFAPGLAGDDAKQLGRRRASSSGALFAALLLVCFRGRLGVREAVFGALVGITSFAGNAALLRALGDTPAYIVFPLVVGGPILTVAILSHLMLGERIGMAGKIGIFCGLVGIVLLTVG